MSSYILNLQFPSDLNSVEMSDEAADYLEGAY